MNESYEFGAIWGWVINDRIFIFGWTIPLTKENMQIKRICWSTVPFFYALNSFIVTHVSRDSFLNALFASARGDTEQVYSVRKAIYICRWLCDLKIAHLFIYKSCTLVKVFLSHNTVLCNELNKNICLYYARENTPLILWPIIIYFLKGFELSLDLVLILAGNCKYR